MSARIRFTFKIEGLSKDRIAKDTRAFFNIRAHPVEGSSGNGPRKGPWGVGYNYDDGGNIHWKLTRAEAATVSDNINETVARIVYAMDNPDTAVRFVDGIPQLITTDDSGVDHEVLFKLGRDA
ncbi:hypothetical protein [Sphingomonas sp. Ant20]|uniref:hypothetical protein n=1 Tax=Sphingomonas sp. Ant20 TaxID=104605 RepID=UPI00053926E3|nr:hypothetical protein [Sphingomonas sp. Ant20]KHA64477.1 hypothetical protein NI18_08820 [Sphingomonas sp. Ant20]